MKSTISKRILAASASLLHLFFDGLFTALALLTAQTVRAMHTVYPLTYTGTRLVDLPFVTRLLHPSLQGRAMRIAATSMVGVAIAFNIFNPSPTLSELSEYEALQTGHPVRYGFPEVEAFEPRVLKSFVSQVTVYNSVPWQTDGDPFTMADGSRVYDGAVAANCLAFGTKIRMPELFGDKVFTVHDRLAADKSCYIIDIWQEYDRNATSFGAPQTTIEILQGSPSSTVAYVR